MKLRHFSKLTEKEVWDLTVHCQQAAIAFTRKLGMSGLSENGSHNIYTMLERGFRAEWEGAQNRESVRQVMQEIKKKRECEVCCEDGRKVTGVN
jgi:hypothetical protein